MMFGNKRRYCVKTMPATPEGLEELAKQLTEYSWTLCSGWKWGRWLFLNDSTSEDGTTEYAVFDLEHPEKLQLESFTVGWMTKERFIEAVLGLDEYGKSAQGHYLPCSANNLKLEDPGFHKSCWCCA